MSGTVERAMRRLDKLAGSASDAEKIASARRAVEYAAVNAARPAHVIEVSDSRGYNAFSLTWCAYVDISWKWPARVEPVCVLLRVGRRSVRARAQLRSGDPWDPILYVCSVQWRPKWREGGVSRHEKFCDNEERAFAWIVQAAEHALEKVDEDLRGRGRR